MLLSESRTRVRKMIRDVNKVGYKDDELDDYINDAINYIFLERAKSNDPQVIKEITINNNDTVPVDYFSNSGEYPIYILGDTFKLYNPAEPVLFRYNAIPSKLVSSTDPLPFKEIYNNLVCRIASIYALNRNEFTVTQDLNLVAMSLNRMKEVVLNEKGK